MSINDFSFLGSQSQFTFRQEGETLMAEVTDSNKTLPPSIFKVHLPERSSSERELPSIEVLKRRIIHTNYYPFISDGVVTLRRDLTRKMTGDTPTTNPYLPRDWSKPVKQTLTFQGHTDTINTLIVLNNGTLVSGSDDRTIKLWDRSGRCKKTLEGHTLAVTTLTELTDGKLASGSNDYTIKLWDQSGICIKTFEGHTDYVCIVIELRDGTLASGSWDNTIKLWDRDGNCLQTFEGHQSPVTTLVELRNGELASGSKDYSIKLWDRSGKCLKTFKGNNAAINALIELVDNTLASASHDCTIKLWDRSGKCLKTFKGHTDSVRALIELQDGTLASAGDCTLKLWNRSGDCLQTLEGHTNGVWALIAFKDGTLASGSFDKSIKLWEGEPLTKGADSQSSPKPQAPPAVIQETTNLSSSLEEKISTIVYTGPLIPKQDVDRTVSTRSIPSAPVTYIPRDWSKPLKPTVTLTGHSDFIRCLIALRDGTLASGSIDGTIKLWDLSGKCLITLKGHTDTIRTLIELSDGILASGSSDNTIKLWNRSGNCILTLEGHTFWVDSLVELKDGILASGSEDNTIKLWDRTGKCLKTIEGDMDEVVDLIELRDGTLVSGSDDYEINLWDRSGRRILTLDGDRYSIISIIELEDGTLACGSADKTIKLFDRTGMCLKTLEGHTDEVFKIIELRDGTLASLSVDNTIKLWNRSGQCLKTLQGHTDAIRALIELKDGTLASCSADKTVKLWDRDGHCLKTLEGHTDEVVDLIELMGGILASSSRDKTIKLWKGALLRSSVNSQSSPIVQPPPIKTQEKPQDRHSSIQEKIIPREAVEVQNPKQEVDLPSLRRSATSSADPYIPRDWSKPLALTLGFYGHSDSVPNLIQLQDGILASGSNDKSIKLWDQKGNCIATLEGHTKEVQILLEFRNCIIISGSCDNTIKVWDLNGNCIKTLLGHKGAVTLLLELRDGTLASGSIDKTIKFWDLSGKCLKTLEGHTEIINSLIELKDGTLASSSKDKTIKLWDRGGNCLKTLEGHTEVINSLVELKDGILASGSADHTIKLWDRKGKCLITLKGHQGAVATIIELRDGTLASGSDDHTLKLWHRTGKCLKTLEGFTETVAFLIELKDGALACISGHNTIKIWDRNGTCLKTARYKGSIDSLIELRNGTLMASGPSKCLLMLEGEPLESGLTPQSGQIPPANIEAKALGKLKKIGVDFSEYGRNAARTSFSYNPCDWSKPLQQTHTFTGHTGYIDTIIELRDGTIVSGGEDQRVQFWDSNGKCLKRFFSIGKVNTLIELKDGNLAGIQKFDGKIYVWDRSGNSLTTFDAASRSTRTLIELRDGTLATGNCDGTITLWERGVLISGPSTSENRLPHLFDVTGIREEFVEGHPISGNNSTNQLNRLVFGFKTNFKGHSESVNTLIELGNGTLASGSDDKTIKIWDRNGKCLTTFEGHTATVNTIIALRDGTLATGSDDKTIKIWDKNGKCLITHKGDSHIIALIELRDGTLASSSSGKTINLWNPSGGGYLQTFKRDNGSAHTLLELKDGRLLGSDGYDIKCWVGAHFISNVNSQDLPSAKIPVAEIPKKPQELTIPPQEKVIPKPTVAALDTKIPEEPPKLPLPIKPKVTTPSSAKAPIQNWSIDPTGETSTATASTARYIPRDWSKPVKQTLNFQGHTNAVNTLILLKDGTIGSGSYDGTIRLWDQSGKCIKILEGHKCAIGTLIELSDGILASACESGFSSTFDHTIKLWDRDGKCLHTLEGHEKAITALIELGDGTLASTSWDNTIKLWDRSGKCLKTLKGHTSVITTLIELRKGTLASGSFDKTIKLWDRNGKCLKTFKGHEESIVTLIILRDGTLASGSGDHTIKLWDQSGKCLQTLKGHTWSVTSLIELSDGTIASGSTDQTIKRWNRSGMCLQTLKGHTDSILALTELRDGTLVSIGYSKIWVNWDNSIKLWDRSGMCLKTLEGSILVEFSDGKLATGSSSNTIKLWEGEPLATQVQPVGSSIAKTAPPAQRLKEPQEPSSFPLKTAATLATAKALVQKNPQGLTLPPQEINILRETEAAVDTKIAKEPPKFPFSIKEKITTTASVEAPIQKWGLDLSGETSTATASTARYIPRDWSKQVKQFTFLKDDRDSFSTCIELNDGSLASASLCKSVKIWDLSGKCLKTFDENTDFIKLLIKLSDGTLASFGYSNKTIKLWDQNGKCLTTLEGHTDLVWSLIELRDGRLASGSVDKTIKLWDRDGRCLKTIKGHTGIVTTLVELSNGMLLSGGSKDNSIKIWDRDGNCLNTLNGHTSHVTTLTPLAEGIFASGSHDSTIKLWDITGKCLKTLNGHTNTVNVLTVLRDGTLVSGSEDKTIKLWDPNGNCIKTLKDLDSVATVIELRNGTLASGSLHGLILWEGEPITTLAQATGSPNAKTPPPVQRLKEPQEPSSSPKATAETLAAAEALFQKRLAELLGSSEAAIRETLAKYEAKGKAFLEQMLLKQEAALEAALERNRSSLSAELSSEQKDLYHEALQKALRGANLSTLTDSQLQRIQSELAQSISPQLERDIQRLMQSHDYQGQMQQLQKTILDEIAQRQSQLIEEVIHTQQEQEEIKGKQSVLFQAYETKQKRLQEQQMLQSHPSVLAFYNTTEKHLSAQLMSAMMLVSGLIVREETNLEKGVKMGSKVAQTLCGAIPIIGEVVGSLISFGIEAGAEHVAERTELKKQNNAFDSTLRFKDAMALAELAARRTSQRFRTHIETLTPEQAAKAGENAANAMYTYLQQGLLKPLAQSPMEDKISALVKAVEEESKKGKGLLHKQGGIFEKPLGQSPASTRHVHEVKQQVDGLGAKVDLMQAHAQVKETRIKSITTEQEQSKAVASLRVKMSFEGKGFILTREKKDLKILFRDLNTLKQMSSHLILIFDKNIVDDCDIESNTLTITASSSVCAKDLELILRKWLNIAPKP